MLFLTNGEAIAYLILLLLVIPFAVVDFGYGAFKILRKKDIRYISRYYVVEFDCPMEIRGYEQVTLNLTNAKKPVAAHIIRLDEKSFLFFFKPPKNMDSDLKRQQFSLGIKSVKHGFYTKIVSEHKYTELTEQQFSAIRASKSLEYRTGFELPILSFIVDIF